MQAALEKLRKQVLSLAGKYAEGKKRGDLDQLFSLLAKELESGEMHSQRLMVFLRGIINTQPGSTKAVNEFLRSEKIARVLQKSGNYSLK